MIRTDRQTDRQTQTLGFCSTGLFLYQVPQENLLDSLEGRRAFSVAGPTVWNSLPDKLRDPSLSIDSFRRQFKTFLFAD